MATHSTKERGRSNRADRELVRHSKRLSWILRHGALESGLLMDEAGWVDVDELLRATGLSHSQLDAVIAANDKRRIERDGGRVRACQGHSLDNGWVCPDALERSWQREREIEWMWHGTAIGALDGIAVRGICNLTRTHVHCADALHSRVGKRASVQLMLRIQLETLARCGHATFRAPNGVLLVRHVPFGAIDGFVAMCRASERRRAEIEERFGLVALDPSGRDPL